jgi:hypothetical protein
MALTKSLHTVTATVNVARMIADHYPNTWNYDPEGLARNALAILGYDIEAFGLSDPTVAAILKQVSKLVKV